MPVLRLRNLHNNVPPIKEVRSNSSFPEASTERARPVSVMIPLDAKLAGVTLFGGMEEDDDRPVYENVGR